MGIVRQNGQIGITALELIATLVAYLALEWEKIRDRTVRPVSSVGAHWCGFASAIVQEVRRITTVVVGVLMQEGKGKDGSCWRAGRSEPGTSASAPGAILAHEIPAIAYRSVLATVISGTVWRRGDVWKLHASTGMTQENSQSSLPRWVQGRDPRGCRSILQSDSSRTFIHFQIVGRSFRP